MIIGLTGSMAAGKSAVSAMLRQFGCYIIDADAAAHDIIKDGEVRNELVRAFGADIIENGEVSRRRLGAKAFGSGADLELLNSITHPRVAARIAEETAAAENRCIAVVIDAPLLIESGLNRSCDCVWLVCANIYTRYARIMKRDGLSRAEAVERTARQMPQWKKKRYADVIIDNDEGLEELEAEVKRAFESTMRRLRGDSDAGG